MTFVFQTKIIVSAAIIFVFLAPFCYCQVETKRLQSLDSVTPGLTFEKLPTQQAEASLTKMSSQLEIGDVRSGKAYEIEVVLQNSRNEALKPLSATTSCNCIVGTIENQLILPNEKGSLLLRIHTAKHDVKQTARIEFEGKLFFDVTLTGRVIPDFAFDQNKDIYHEDLVAKANTVVVLKPQYPDIDLSSVDIVATQE